MAKKERFTKTKVAALPKPARDRLWYSDTVVAGLTLAVYASGKRVYFVYKKINGRPERIRLGESPALTVETARKRANQIIGQIASGANPAQSRRELTAENTFGQLAALYFEHAKANKRSWAKDQGKFDRYLQRLGARKLSALTTRDFADVHQKITRAGHPTGANRVLSLASAIFGEARKSGAWRGDNPCKGIARNREHHRKRFLRGDELRAFLTSVQAEPNTTMRDMVMTALLTGARRGNVQQMRWNEIRFDLGEWRIPAVKAKAGEVLVIPLVLQVLSILRERQQNATGEFVFASERDGKHGYFQGTGKAWARILARAGISDLRVHDLRHAFASWQVNTGTSLAVVGASLGHQSSVATSRYAHVAADPVRESVTRATSAMLAEGTSQASAVIVPLVNRGS